MFQMTEPIFFTNAKKEIGVKELPENRGPAIRRYIELAHCGEEGDPWCAIFANAMLELSGFKGTRSALARSFEHSNDFIKLSSPALGCIVTFWRGSKYSGLGHVGFYNGELNGYISTLGGNESDMVRVEMLRSDGNSFGLSGYYWPKPLDIPQLGIIKPQPILQVSLPSTGKVI